MNHGLSPMSSPTGLRSENEMSISKSLRLTLIVAATPKLGIGTNGALPWHLKSEMQYFARVTTRLPNAYGVKPSNDIQNAVIMGRKTWESIPKKFRPLKNRLNIVLTSKADSSDRQAAKLVDGAVWVKSLEQALQVLHELRVESGKSQTKEGDLPRVARAFIIGGATVYQASLKLPNGIADRVLLTRVYGDFSCDTFFPIALDGKEGETAGWSRRSKQEISNWVHEDVEDGRIKEGDVEFEYCMFERAA